MSRRGGTAVNPASITTLDEWAALWGKVPLVGFDPKSREPTVYESSKEGAARLKPLAWVREGDTLTILTNPTQFGTTAVQVAEKRYAKFRADTRQAVVAGEGALLTAEMAMLAAWRAYKEAGTAAERTALRPAILAAEKDVRVAEASLARASYPGRVIRPTNKGTGTYVPPFPLSARAIPTKEAAEGMATAAASTATG
jgi:hypothetical protein